jgi:hypothetical protein
MQQYPPQQVNNVWLVEQIQMAIINCQDTTTGARDKVGSVVLVKDSFGISFVFMR